MFAFLLGFPVARDPFLPKNAPSATFTSPSALRGQRPRWAHGPSAAFQDGQPPALASPAAGQLPGTGVNTAGTPPPESLHGAELGADHPGPRATACPPHPRGQKAHPSPVAPWQVSRTISSLRNTPLCHRGCRFPDLSCPGRCGCGKLLTIPGVRGAGWALGAGPAVASLRPADGPAARRDHSSIGPPKCRAHSIDFSI